MKRKPTKNEKNNFYNNFILYNILKRQKKHENFK